MLVDTHANTQRCSESLCHNYSSSWESLWLHFKAHGLTVANDEHSYEEQRDSHPNSTLKKPLPIFYVEIKDENSRPTVANVRLSTHTDIHKCIHGQTHLSCKCRIITVVSVEGKSGCLLKIVILKRFIDVMLVNGREKPNGCLAHSFLHKIHIYSIAWDSRMYFHLFCMLGKPWASAQQGTYPSSDAVIITIIWGDLVLELFCTGVVTKLF